MPGALGTVYGNIRIDARQAVASYVAVRAQNAKTVYALRGAGDSFIQSGKTMAAAGGLMLYAFGKAVSAAAEFQRRMDFFGAVTNANKKQIQELSKYTLQLGQNSIFSVNDIADGMIELGKAGIGTKGILEGIGKAMVNLGTSADIPLAEAGQIITSTLKTFQIGAGQATRVVNLLQGAANATIADVSDIGTSLKYVGGIAATTGISLHDTITAISLLAQAGIRGSTAGTSLRQMLVSLGGATAPAALELQKLGIITKNGTNLFYDQAGNIKPLAQVYQILQDHTKKLNNEQRLAALRTIFNNRALASASILSRAGAKGFEKMSAALGKTTAAEIAHKRLDNLAGDIKKLKAAIQVFLVRAGSPFQQQMRGWVQHLTKLVKAFGKLDPHTQKMIIQTIAMSGAILVAMGAFNIIIGTFLKFIANVIQMGAALGFLFKWIRIIIVNLRWLVVLFGGELAAALGISLGVLLVIVAVIAAVATGAVVLYKKWKPFRDIVDKVAKAVWNAIKAFGRFIKTIAQSNPGEIWGKLKDGAKKAVDAVGHWFSQLPGIVWAWLRGVLKNIGQFIGGVVGWFAALPGKVLGIITNFISQLVSLFTLKNVGFAIGYAIGTWIRLWWKLQSTIWRIAWKLVSGVFKFFVGLIPKIVGVIANLANKVAQKFLQLHDKMVNTARKVVTAIVNFFKKLPGRAVRFVNMMVVRSVKLFNRVRTEGPAAIAAAVRGIIKWFSQLPGRVTGFIVRMAGKVKTLLNHMKSSMVTLANNTYNGFINALADLPSAMGDILHNMISLIKSLITDAFNAVKGFAGAMWDGFKSGLGINSPSYIERAMWQITGVMDTETKKMARHTKYIQKMSGDLAKTSWQVGDPKATLSNSKYVSLASMHHRNLQRSRTLQTNPYVRRAARDSQRRARPSQGTVPFKITNWHEGRGHMADIAADVYDDNDSFYESTGRMDR